MSQINENKLLEQFFKDYQALSFTDLFSKYQAQEYWNIMNSNKLFQYAKNHNLFDILVAKNPQHLYTELTQVVDKYQVQMAHGALYDFDTLESAVKFKFETFTEYLFSSPNWK